MCPEHKKPASDKHFSHDLGLGADVWAGEKPRDTLKPMDPNTYRRFACF
jgi:hypothetical protein